MASTDSMYIYLSSLASSDLFRNNKTSSFQNVVQPLHLSEHLEYEVGLVNLLYQQELYTLVKDDPTFGVNIHLIVVEGDNTLSHPILWTHLPDKANNVIKEIIREIIDDIKHIVTHSPHLKQNFFQHEDILSDEKQDRCVITNVTEVSQAVTELLASHRSYECSK